MPETSPSTSFFNHRELEEGRHQVTHTAEAFYLGDGVYVDVDPARGIVLTAENGMYATSIIYLEPSVLQSFLDYMERLKTR